MKIIPLLVKSATFSLLCVGLHFFCEKQTEGFRPYMILSNLPNDPRWETPPLTGEEKKEIDRLLDQPFTYLGKGGWCFAFLGKDKKTILKFYRHTHFLPGALWNPFSWKKLLLKSPRLPAGTPYFQEFNFKSCALLCKRAKERTGLLYTHLNKTEGVHKPVTLIDPLGIEHTIDLDETEFLVQKRAELLFPHLDKLAKKGKTPQAKHSIDDFLRLLLMLYKEGIRDYDHSLRNNFGFTDDGAIALDLSSFGPDETLKHPGEYKKEIIVKTQTLGRFLRKNHGDLHLYFEERLKEIMETGDLTDPVRGEEIL